ncbi:zinc finger MYM-type protein 4 isoform X2 [Betta splendens]|nr:zinc finger MYM-type protein 4 isoform X2 [Betta splendens]
MESMEAAHVGDTEFPRSSPAGLSEHEEESKPVAAKEEMEGTEGKYENEITSPTSVSRLNPSPLQSSRAGETCSAALADSCEPGISSEAEEDRTEVKTEGQFVVDDITIIVKQNDLDQSSSGPDVSMDTNPDLKDEGNTEEKMDQDSDTMEATGMQSISIAPDLDAVMDIGAVDQMDQEAQMKEEECNSLDTDSSQSLTVSNAVSGAESSSSNVEGVDVKPTVLPPPADEDVKVALDLIQSSMSPLSEATASTGRDSSPAAMINGIKTVKLAKQGTLEEAAQSVKLSPSPPLVKVKDEPIDEEYEHALVSSSSITSVKDEPLAAKEDLKIGSVFSVTTESQALPVVHPSAAQMSCSHCKKGLMKGQTAYQRRGSSSLFCSTTCLTASLPLKGVTKICHSCQKVILRPQDVILAPDAQGATKDFCSQNCLTSFNYKKESSKSLTNKKISPKLLCSMCTRNCVSKHEVVLNGTVHKLCSDACFQRFRSMHSLSLNGCASCGTFTHSKPLLLKLEDGNKTVCNEECLSKLKEKIKTTHPCTMCHTVRPMSETIHNRNNDDSVSLFCSSSCVMAFMVQSVSSSGAQLNCDTCGKKAVPAYHLAMSDTTIRNFCTLSCVMVFQEKFKSQKQVNVFTKLPIGPAQIEPTPSTQPQQEAPINPPKLSCFQCTCDIVFKPELIQIKDKLVFVCSMDCSLEFKKSNSLTNLCEYCKIEKITRDAKRFDTKDCHFCSDGCKLLYKHDLTKNWGEYCHSCVYCHCVSKKLVTAQYGNFTEQFCSEECRSKYTMLFCHVAKCDTCGRKRRLRQSLPMMGEVKHFCDLNCLLQFCSDTVATQGEVLTDKEEPTPVIASVVSLAGSQDLQTEGSDTPAEKSTVSKIQSKRSGHIGVQTDTVKPHFTAPKILKNKALLCRPLVQNKGVSCKTQTTDAESQTSETFPKVLVLPVPVPVYVPVPMNMYSQCTPQPVGLPLPLPVPMFLPVTMDSAESIVETIQEIKEKIPSDPFEAELILMAEMVAEQETDAKRERPKEKVVEKETERQETQAPEDHVSNYSDDLDTDDLSSFLNNWDDTSSDAGRKSPARLQACVRPSDAQEKLNPITAASVALPSERYSEPSSPAPRPMDIEADFTVETLERMAQEREDSQRAQSPPCAPPRRRQAHRKARVKRGRPSQRSSKAAEDASTNASSNKVAAVEIPKLRSQYGVDAWKRWIQWRRTQPNLRNPRFGSRPIELKEDVLLCATAELSYGLCCFIAEVKRPNGEPYSPDSLFYLCLGIQQHLFENGRVENIFMDLFYNKFSIEFTNMLKAFTPSVTASGYIHSRVEEEYLWECKQLGAYSPIVLLNTLLFFCCKYFGFTTVEQHRQLSFAHVMRCTKTNPNNTKTTLLRFYPPICTTEAETDAEVPAKKRKEDENKDEVLEMAENTENPLRCPVRLYEFYLSKCSESVKQRTNIFYLHPERCCVPNSPLWFSSTALDDSTMEAMLTRILTVRELHLGTRKEGGGVERQTTDDPPFTPDGEEDGDSE